VSEKLTVIWAFSLTENKNIPCGNKRKKQEPETKIDKNNREREK
jgi:hypothetical protein